MCRSLADASNFLSLYCDDTCRARDGQASTNAHASPSIFAMPGLVASRSRRDRTDGNAGITSMSASSQSANSSPLQSPSPLAEPHAAGVSPQEDALFLPPPLYPTAGPHFSNGLASSQPTKIPSSYRPTNARASIDQANAHALLPDATLQFGRRPGQTNSVTSPLALYPVGGSYSRRRESNDKLVRPGMGMSPPRLGQAQANGRIVSDSAASTSSHNSSPGLRASRAERPLGQGHLYYGQHSPLIVAARRPTLTSAIDAVDAQGSLTSVGSTGTVRARAGAFPSSLIKLRGDGEPTTVRGTSGSVTYFDRRKSFPLRSSDGTAQVKPVIQAPVPQSVDASEALSGVHLSDADNEDEDDERRGRGRKREKTSGTQREWSSSRSGGVDSASRSRESTRHRSSHGRSPSTSRDRRAQRNQRDVIPEHTVKSATAAQQSSTESSRSGSRIPSAQDSKGRPTASRPAAIAATAGPKLHNPNVINLSHISTAFQLPTASYRPTGEDWRNTFGTIERRGSRSPPIPRNGFERHAKAASPMGKPVGIVAAREANADSKAARELRRLFEEGVAI